MGAGNIFVIFSFPGTMRKLLFLLLFFPFISYAQDDPEKDKEEMFTISTPITIDLGEKEEEEHERKEKKPKKKAAPRKKKVG